MIDILSLGYLGYGAIGAVGGICVVTGILVARARGKRARKVEETALVLPDVQEINELVEMKQKMNELESTIKNLKAPEPQKTRTASDKFNDLLTLLGKREEKLRQKDQIEADLSEIDSQIASIQDELNPILGKVNFELPKQEIPVVEAPKVEPPKAEPPKEPFEQEPPMQVIAKPSEKKAGAYSAKF